MVDMGAQGPRSSPCPQARWLQRTARLLLVLPLLVAWRPPAASALPPRLEDPQFPVATVSHIEPTYGEVNAVNFTVTFIGTGFTEEYGAGSLRCRFHLLSGPVTVCAHRDLDGCVPSTDGQWDCTTTRLTCTAPVSDVAQRVLVQVTNDYGVMLFRTDENDAELPHYTLPHEPRWSEEEVYFTYVPRVFALTPMVDDVYPAPDAAPTQRITVYGEGFADVGSGRATKCVFTDAGYDARFPPPVPFHASVRSGNESHSYYVTDAAVGPDGTSVACDVPASTVARTLLVTVTPDYVDTLGISAVVECPITDACNHLAHQSPVATYTYRPIVSSFTPVSGPHGSVTTVEVTGQGFVANDVQVLTVASGHDTSIGGVFRGLRCSRRAAAAAYRSLSPRRALQCAGATAHGPCRWHTMSAPTSWRPRWRKRLAPAPCRSCAASRTCRAVSTGPFASATSPRLMSPSH